MTSVIFLISSGGGNLKFVKWATEMLGLNIKIELVLADRECGGLEFSAAVGIPHKRINYSRDSYEELQKTLEGKEPSMVITNMHKILDPLTLHTGHRFVNLHYSILPAFKGMIGMKPIQAARLLNSPFLGVTTHHVIEEVDSGPILQQSIFNVNWNGKDTEITDTVFKLGAITLLNTILSNGDRAGSYPDTMKIDNFDIRLSNALKFDYRDLERKNIWQRINNDSIQ